MRYFYNIFSIFLLFYVLKYIQCKRLKRSLIYPKAKVQLIFGMGIPVSLEDMSVTMGYSLRAYYLLPSNASHILNPSDILARREKSLPLRLNIYKTLANVLERVGGKSCVLKAICELTSHNLKKGFMEELVNYIFRPSSIREEISEPMDREYIAAENIGIKTEGRCKNLYPECSLSLVDLFVRRKYKTVTDV